VLTEAIGWLSSLVLLLTIGRQVYTQWRARTTAGLSRWLFVGQVTASLGFTAYSILLKNWVFVFTNAMLLVTAVIGQWIYLRNKNSPAPSGASPPGAR
jgi:uncharacterized protein with PQ loop repeat